MVAATVTATRSEGKCSGNFFFSVKGVCEHKRGEDMCLWECCFSNYSCSRDDN